MRGFYQILVKLDFGVREGGHYVGPIKSTFQEGQCENPPTVPDLYEENNEGGFKTLKYLRSFPSRP